MNNSFADWNPMEDGSNNTISTNPEEVLDNTVQIPVPNTVPNESMNSVINEGINYSPNTSLQVLGDDTSNMSGVEGNNPLPENIINQGTIPLPTNDMNSVQTLTENTVTIPAQTLESNPSNEVAQTTPFYAPVVDPTATYGDTSVPVNSVVEVNASLDSSQSLSTPEPQINPVLSNSGIHAETINPNVRFNPVTGEEIDVSDLLSKKEDVPQVEDKKKKKKDKASSTWNSILVFFLFVFLVVFVYFLPEIHTVVTNYQKGIVDEEVQVITTGKLVCTLEANTVDLDRNIERVFRYENNQLKSAKFTTIVRGDPSLDEEALDKLNEQCLKIKENVNNLDGVIVDCRYELGSLEEKESFDYSIYQLDEVSNAYLDAGASVVELDYDEDIDQIMVKMRQGGFTCNKEK